MAVSQREKEKIGFPNGTGACLPKIPCGHHLCLSLTPFQLIVTSSLLPLGKLHCSLILAAWHWLGTEIANALIFNHLPSWCMALDTFWVSLAVIHIDRIASTPQRASTVLFSAGFNLVATDYWSHLRLPTWSDK